MSSTQPQLQPDRRPRHEIDPGYESFEHAQVVPNQVTPGYGVVAATEAERNLDEQRDSGDAGIGGAGDDGKKGGGGNIVDDFLSDPDSSEWPEGVSAKERERQIKAALHVVGALPDLAKATTGGYDGAHALLLGSLGLKESDLLTLEQIKRNVNTD